METLISQLLDLPDQVHRGDFVLNLSEGVTADHAAATLRDYVVTDQLAAAFDNAPGFVRDEAQGLGYTLEQVRGWEPPAKTRGGRGRRGS